MRPCFGIRKCKFKSWLLPLGVVLSSNKNLNITGPQFPHLKNGTILVPVFLCHRVLGKSNGKAP